MAGAEEWPTNGASTDPANLLGGIWDEAEPQKGDAPPAPMVVPPPGPTVVSPRNALSQSSWKGGGPGKGGAPTQVPGANVFVFYLPTAWDENDLRRILEHCGTITHCVVQRKPDGESKGCGFVGFDRPEAARDAVYAMHGFCTGSGKFLSLNIKKGEEHAALPIPDYPPAGRLDVPVPAQGDPPPGATIFIFYLPRSWSEAELHRHFIHCGSLVFAAVSRKHDGESKGFGWVGFDNPASAQRAVRGMHGFNTGEGRFLKVDIKKGEEGFAPTGVVVPPPAAPTLVHVQPAQSPAESVAESVVQAVYETAVASVQSLLQESFEATLRAMHPSDEVVVLRELASGRGIMDSAIARIMNDATSRFLANPSGGALATSGPAVAAVDPAPTTGLLAARSTATGRADMVPEGANVYIFRVPDYWNEAELENCFAPFGSIVSTRVERHPDGSSRGFGFVGFDSPDSASLAIAELHGKQVEGKTLYVQMKKAAPPRSGPY